MNKGFVIMAQGYDYVKCANALEKSIKKYMPDCNVTIINTEMLPYGDQCKDTNWKLQNDWQVYEASPYEYTIKLEADILVTRSIEHWFDILKERDLVVCTTIRNFKQEIITDMTYRRFIDDNNLPNVYNAITYFKKSSLANTFYAVVREIFENWKNHTSYLKCDIHENATTDWVYALACHIIGVEKTTLPIFKEMSMIHMKRFINNLPTDDWTDSLIYEFTENCFRVNTYPQLYPFHYHIKKFSDEIIKNG